MNRNEEFLSRIDSVSKALILRSIADHYGVEPEVIEEEVTSPEAESLLDYMVEPHRSAAYVLWQRHGMA